MKRKEKSAKADGAKDILQQLDVWKQAGVPRPPQRLLIEKLLLPRDISTGHIRLVRQTFVMLDELMPWCILRRDYPSAVAICAMMWRALDLYRLRKPLKMLRSNFQEHGRFQIRKRSIIRLLESTAEIMLASGRATQKPLLSLLKTLVVHQINVRRMEMAALEMAVQRLEEGAFGYARELLIVKVSGMSYGPVKANRTALLGLTAYLEWMRPYCERLREAAAADWEEKQRRVEGGGGLAQTAEAAAATAAAPSPRPPPPPLHPWEHVPRAWSRASLNPSFREDWRESERDLREALRHLPGSTTKLSYYLAQCYCAAGRVGHAATAAATALRAAPGDPDAVALAVLVGQLGDSYRLRLRRLEGAAGLPAGAAAPLLGLRLGGERRGGGGRARGEVEEEEARVAVEEEEAREVGRVGGLRGASSPSASQAPPSPSSEERAKEQEDKAEEGPRRLSAPAAVAAVPRRGSAAALLASAVGARTAPGAAAAPAAAENDDNADDEAAAAARASQRHGPAAAAQRPRKRGRPAAQSAAGISDAGGGSAAAKTVHSAVEMQLAAVCCDPLCAAALAGLARTGDHCGTCALALIRGCLLHLDVCTTGLLYSPYEGEAWVLLDSALSRLATAAAAAPREPQHPEMPEAWAVGNGAAAGEVEGAPAAGGRRRKRRRRAGGAPPPEAAAVALWRNGVEPELRERAQWWLGGAFSEPPLLCGSGFGGTVRRAPDEALLQHLQHRARVAAVMLGPFNLYTQHVLYELHLLRQRLTVERDTASGRREREEQRRERRRREQQDCGLGPAGAAACAAAAAAAVSDSCAMDEDGQDLEMPSRNGYHRAMGCGGDGIDSMDWEEEEEHKERGGPGGGAAAPRRATTAAADAAAVDEGDLGSVDACQRAVLEAVETAKALARRLAPLPPPSHAAAAPAASLAPLPSALLASLPRALRRRAAAS